ncbi:carbohydrate ABC transporter permease [Kocuria rosea]|jgi:raffinose/stachyose/melibiose transport system permease protein|uniref:carbohydrate ABC transporter permease n=1 Tax=Kocuria rosea TaxID=1275 RepID=UPI000D656D5C|nr:carbohydrate ABC transporter permease [Kocuria rosea]PWF87517.1 ABC transporter permease [Kocuria rosea]STX02836.1 Inner membrane ABC transporter permease protein ycjP [Kocuria rosea]STX06367.1 Inner membrane ABC transporter permease protein ycjP [Kocuria rosea]
MSSTNVSAPPSGTAATTLPARSRRSGRRRPEGGRVNWWLTALLVVLALTVFVPLYFTVITSLKTPDQLGGSGFALPTEVRWANFADAWTLTDFPRAALNSALITVSAVVLTLLTNSMVAYAIARNMHRRFFKGLFFYFISALFVPFPILMLPVAKQTAALGLDNPAGLVLLYVVYGLSFNIFIFTAYIRSIPVELEEAARMDGAGTWGVFWRVVFPLLTPMNATVGILTCLWAWNDFLLPLIIVSDPQQATLPLVQYVFQSQFQTNYTVAFASYLMAMAPLLVVYVFAQRWVISGVTRGAVK